VIARIYTYKTPARSGQTAWGECKNVWLPGGLLSGAWDAGADYRSDAGIEADSTDAVIVGVGQEHAAARIG
jgi:hypothetical protein